MTCYISTVYSGRNFQTEQFVPVQSSHSTPTNHWQIHQTLIQYSIITLRCNINNIAIEISAAKLSYPSCECKRAHYIKLEILPCSKSKCEYTKHLSSTSSSECVNPEIECVLWKYLGMNKQCIYSTQKNWPKQQVLNV